MALYYGQENGNKLIGKLMAKIYGLENIGKRYIFYHKR